MLQPLGWRSLEQRRFDSKLCLFYKIIYGLVAIDMPPYVVHPLRTLRNPHTLGFPQIQYTVDYYKYSYYPLSIVQWNQLPAHIALLPTFDFLRGHSQSPSAINVSVLFLNFLAYHCQPVSDFHILTLSSFIPLQLTNLMELFYF